MKQKIQIIICLSLILFTGASCNFLSGTSSLAGILKTSNGGVDWQFSNQIKENSKVSLGADKISSIIFDPTRNDRLIAGTYTDGVYVSEDGGERWKQILSKLSVYQVVINPNDTQVIYAAGMFDKRGRVLLTTDGGGSWKEVFVESSNNNPVRTIALNPDNDQEVVIGSQAGSIIASRDGGKNWRLLQSYNDRVNRIEWRSDDMLVLLRDVGLMKSLDDGISFSNITSSLSPNRNNAQVLISSSGIGTFNQVATSRNNQNLLFITTDRGLYRTINSGDTWEYLPLPKKQNEVETHAVKIAPSSDFVVYVSAGAYVYRTSDSGISWQAENPLVAPNYLVNTIAIHPEIAQLAYLGIYY